jgi:hypothetical protein
MKINTQLIRHLGSMRYHFEHGSEQMQARLRNETLNDLLAFTSKEDYLEWVTDWKRLYKLMTHEARKGEAFEFMEVSGTKIPRYFSRDHRWAMMLIRMDGKKKSWAMKQANLPPVDKIS